MATGYYVNGTETGVRDRYLHYSSINTNNFLGFEERDYSNYFKSGSGVAKPFPTLAVPKTYTTLTYANAPYDNIGYKVNGTSIKGVDKDYYYDANQRLFRNIHLVSKEGSSSSEKVYKIIAKSDKVSVLDPADGQAEFDNAKSSDSRKVIRIALAGAGGAGGRSGSYYSPGSGGGGGAGAFVSLLFKLVNNDYVIVKLGKGGAGQSESDGGDSSFEFYGYNAYTPTCKIVVPGGKAGSLNIAGAGGDFTPQSGAVEIYGDNADVLNNLYYWESNPDKFSARFVLLSQWQDGPSGGKGTAGGNMPDSLKLVGCPNPSFSIFRTGTGGAGGEIYGGGGGGSFYRSGGKGGTDRIANSCGAGQSGAGGGGSSGGAKITGGNGGGGYLAVYI